MNIVEFLPYHTEFVPTETCTIFSPLPGACTSAQFSPVGCSRRMPVRTIALPLYSTAHTNPVGPTLI